MILTLKHLYNSNIKFLFFYLKIKITSVEDHLFFINRFFDSRGLSDFFFLDFCFLFTKTKGNYFYIKIIFFFFNILDVSVLYTKLISEYIDFQIGWGKHIFKVKKVSTLNVKDLNCLLKTGVFKYSLTIFDLTKNFEGAYETLSSLIKIKIKKIILINNTEDYLLPIKKPGYMYPRCYDFKILKKRRKKPTDLLIYLIKVYFFRNEQFHLKNILKHYNYKKGEIVDPLEGWTRLGPRIYFYEYLKNNFDLVLIEIYGFYYKKFTIVDEQMFTYFLYVFINADRKKILTYFEFDNPEEYSFFLKF